MALFEIAALLSFGALSATTQGEAAATILPAPDTAEQRMQQRRFSGCLAAARANWARDTLAAAYLSEDQASRAARALSGRDNCLPAPETEMTFRTSTMVGGLAEHFVRSELRVADLPRVSRALSRLEPRNASEDFALCIAARDPVAARDLALSDPGSSAEQTASTKLAAFVPVCTAPGERLTVDMQALRSLTSIALYLSMRTSLASSD